VVGRGLQHPGHSARGRRARTDRVRAYLPRLRRIEGQVRGLQRQIEEDTYCIDVLQPIVAVSGALQNVAIGLLDEHVGHCVANAAGDQNKARDMVTEATQAIARIIKA